MGNGYEIGRPIRLDGQMNDTVFILKSGNAEPG